MYIYIIYLYRNSSCNAQKSPLDPTGAFLHFKEGVKRLCLAFVILEESGSVIENQVCTTVYKFI